MQLVLEQFGAIVNNVAQKKHHGVTGEGSKFGAHLSG